MEIAGTVKATAAGRLCVAGEKQSERDFSCLGTKGQIITGKISGVSEDKVSLDFGKLQLQVSSREVKDAREGEERSFEIMDVSKQRIVLKEVETAMGQQNDTSAIVRTMVGNDKANFSELLEKSGMSEESITDDSEELKDVCSRMTGADWKDMESEGMSLEKYKLTTLDRMLGRVKTLRMEKQKGLEDTAQKQQMQGDEIAKMAVQAAVEQGVNEGDAQQIMAALVRADLPVTQSNITTVASVMNMAAVAPEFSERAMQYMLEQELEPTIGNVYQAQYAGNGAAGGQYFPYGATTYQSDTVIYEKSDFADQLQGKEDTWAAIEGQAQQIVLDAGMEPDAEHMMQAKWLFLNDLPLTAETLQQCDILHRVKNQYDEAETLQKVVTQFSQGQELQAVSLVPEEFSDTQKSVEAFLAAVQEELQLYVTDSQSQQYTQTDTEDASVEEAVPVISLQAQLDHKLQEVTRKRQLEEVRLKMTADAATRMTEKGISLDVEHLEKIVEELRQWEDEYYQGLLGEDGVASPEDVKALRDTQETVQSLAQAPSYILGSTLSRKNEITLKELQQEGTALQSKLAQAGAAYETLMTRPDRELGDSIQKAFRNVEDILSDLGLDTTEENVRAVKILAYNNMAITEEHIFKVKEYDMQVNKLLQDLHPAVTVELIRRNVNPLDISITELDEQVNAIKEELGVSDTEKYSKYLYQLEQKNGISQEERTAFINIYKLLNNIQKMNGAAVGYVLQTDRDMTLENLLTAVRTLKSGGVEEQITDSTDMQDIQFSRSVLLTQLQETFSKEKPDKQKYYDRVVDALAEEVSPSVLEAAMTEEDGSRQDLARFMGRDVEELLESMQKIKVQQAEEEEPEYSYEEEVLKNIRKLADNSQGVVHYLQSNEMPVTVENLMAANALPTLCKELRNKAKSSSEDVEKLESAMEELADGLEDRETMQSRCEKLAEAAENMLERQFSQKEIQSGRLQELRILADSVGLLQKAAGREDYQVPVLVGENVTNIHLTILHGSGQTGSMTARVTSDSLGNVMAQFEIVGDEVQGSVTCSSKKAADTMESMAAEFGERLEAQGMEQGRIIYGIQTKSMEAYEKTQDTQDRTADTGRLYQIAKAFVKHIAYLEEQFC